MADVHDKITRSYNMSRIRAKNTKPEIIVRSYLFGKGFRYRLHSKNLPGKPDIVLPKYKTVIFINGCFWHGHEGCRYFVVPQTRTDWWLGKIRLTQKQNVENTKKLEAAGWKVLTIWECQLKNELREQTLLHLTDLLTV